MNRFLYIGNWGQTSMLSFIVAVLLFMRVSKAEQLYQLSSMTMLNLEPLDASSLGILHSPISVAAFPTHYRYDQLSKGKWITLEWVSIHKTQYRYEAMDKIQVKTWGRPQISTNLGSYYQTVILHTFCRDLYRTLLRPRAPLTLYALV